MRAAATSPQDSDRRICYGSSQGVFLSLAVCYEQDARCNDSVRRIGDPCDIPCTEHRRDSRCKIVWDFMAALRHHHRQYLRDVSAEGRLFPQVKIGDHVALDDDDSKSIYRSKNTS
ncbi:uncharacterized protein LOC143359168 [Halictus rubicundus]|uniref:uncharacterized protein LOC143359168 n=1 Tax=Halictus rubicundus TaxID=77578 RepID=UPI00403619D7